MFGMSRQPSFLISTLTFALLIFGGANAQEREYTGWAPHSLRAHAFEKVQMHLNVSQLHPASDPDYKANCQAIKQNQPLLPGHEIIEVQKDGSYTVAYTNLNVVAYTATGKTEAAGKMNQKGFPRKTVLYNYPSGQLKRVDYRLSPKDIFVFDATGNLIRGNLESAFWERPTYEKRVATVGLKLLAANHIKEKITFSIEPSRASVNAGSNETSNRVEITKGMLATIESEDELAAVLAHEIAHILLRHRHIYPAPTHDELLLQKKFRIPIEPRRDSYEYSQSHDKELDADRKGLRMLVRAGYRPEAMISILQKIASDGSERDWMTHPSGSHRIKALQMQIRAMQAGNADASDTALVMSALSNETAQIMPADKMTIQQWNWQKARDAVLKQDALTEAIKADWANFPKKDPEHDIHIKAIQNGTALPGYRLLYQEATGLYAKLLQNTQHGTGQYAIQYPETRAYFIFNLSGETHQVALCNQAAFPRVCQLCSAPDARPTQRLFEITETDSFIFDSTGNLVGYRLASGLYNLQGQPIAKINQIKLGL